MKVYVLVCFVLIVGIVSAWECKDGVSYIENDCNNCFCGNGNLACQAKFCMGKHFDDLKNCEVGTTYKKDCNDCECLDKKRGVICTNNKC